MKTQDIKNLLQNEKFKKELNQLKWSNISILLASSFVLSLGLAHQYKALPEYSNLYLLALSGYIVSYFHKKLGIKYLIKKFAK